MVKTLYWKTGILLLSIAIVAVFVFTLGLARITNAKTVAAKSCSAKWQSTFSMDQDGNISKGSYANVYEKVRNGCDFKVVVDTQGQFATLKSFYCGTVGTALPPGGGIDAFECRDSANRYAFRFDTTIEPGKATVQYGKLNDDGISNLLEEGEIQKIMFYVFTKG